MPFGLAGKNLEINLSNGSIKITETDPKLQDTYLGGRGIGTKLLQRFCKEVDACSASAYLETDTDKNVRFYQKFNFRMVDESEIFGVNNRYMWRNSK